MIKDKPNRLVAWLMTGVVWYMLRQFRKVTFIGEIAADREKASLVLMNHFSFNDGAVLHYYARKILRKRFKVMVVEDQLKSFKLLRYVGCFSVSKKSRSVIESLNYAAGLLKDRRNMLGIFPQGEVFSMHLNQVHFESGLRVILNRSKDVAFQTVFGVVLLDYLDDFKPHARVYLEEYTGKRDLVEMERAYNEFYRQCKVKQQQLHRPPGRVIDER